jgi:small-conductance mechanosensitive channel
MVPEVLKEPGPLVIVSEMTDSWFSMKLVYHIDSYGSQYVIADRVITAALESLSSSGIPIATPKLTVVKAAEA